MCESASDSTSFTSLVEVHRAVSDEIGVNLFTILAFTDEGRTMHRIYSSHPEEYPVGGKKDVARDVASDWIARCVEQQSTYFGRTRVDVERIFVDAALIAGLGCSSIINAPIIGDGVTIGALNILDAEGTYDVQDVDTALRIARNAGTIIEKTIKELK